MAENRAQKTYTRPAADERTNKFTINLGGLRLAPAQIDTIRNHALKNALIAAASILRGGDKGLSLNDFSTFSTFSTFSSGIEKLPADARNIIDRVVGSPVEVKARG